MFWHVHNFYILQSLYQYMAPQHITLRLKIQFFVLFCFVFRVCVVVAGWDWIPWHSPVQPGLKLCSLGYIMGILLLWPPESTGLCQHAWNMWLWGWNSRLCVCIGTLPSGMHPWLHNQLLKSKCWVQRALAPGDVVHGAATQAPCWRLTEIQAVGPHFKGCPVIHSYCVRCCPIVHHSLNGNIMGLGAV